MYKSDIISVSGLNMYIKSLIDSDRNLNSILIEGEISNYVKHYKSGHIYFSLKDRNSVVKAVMFAQSARFLRFEPCDGMKVICRARVSVYETSGQYQLYVDDMQPDGAGAHALAFEQLKQKLEKEGLFDASYKKQIPLYPEKIGIITSATSAAINDIINVISRRYPAVCLVLCDVLVQGENASKQMIGAIEKLNKEKACDVIIIGRGGGAYEDLTAFNDENLARAIFASDIPIISAVGHETDFTICDFVSDLRAPTPSAAAELAVPDREELLNTVISCYSSLMYTMENIINSKKMYLDYLDTRLNVSDPNQKLNLYSLKLQEYTRRLHNIGDRILEDKYAIVTNYAQKLNALNPLNVLLRGYSVVYKDGKILKTSKNVKKGDKIDIKLLKGNLKCSVDEVERINENE